MHLRRLLFYTALALGLITLTKVFFVVALDSSNIYLTYVMWFLVAVWSTAFTRRLGILNYVESIFVAALWTIGSLVLDYLIVVTLVGPDVYRHLLLWISYLIIILVVFLFHKKRHVEIRRQKAVQVVEEIKKH
jgi:hypothetical protein